jgi:DNA polymerase III subunit gamma/tau
VDVATEVAARADDRPPAEPVASIRSNAAEAVSPNAGGAGIASARSNGSGSDNAGPVRVDAASAERVWREALECMTGFVGEFASTATKISADGQGRLVVSFPESQKFNRDLCLRPANLGKLDAALEQVCGGRVLLTLATHPDPEGSVPTAAETARPNPKQQQADAAADPFVKRAVELFDADADRLRYVAPRDGS